MSFANASLRQLRLALDSKQVSAVELAEYFLSRAEAAQDLNAFLQIDRSLTMVEARAADARIATGSVGALTGIPIAHKDIFVTKDWRSTAGNWPSAIGEQRSERGHWRLSWRRSA